MPKVQGDFARDADALRAVQALTAAGVPASHIHRWNIIPESPPPARPSGNGARTGALAGAVAGGLLGLAAGGTLGAALDAAYSGTRHLPSANGVRVVVDELASGPDVAAVLRECGAANVR